LFDLIDKKEYRYIILSTINKSGDWIYLRFLLAKISFLED